MRTQRLNASKWEQKYNQTGKLMISTRKPIFFKINLKSLISKCLNYFRIFLHVLGHRKPSGQLISLHFVSFLIEHPVFCTSLLFLWPCRAGLAYSHVCWGKFCDCLNHRRHASHSSRKHGQTWSVPNTSFNNHNLSRNDKWCIDHNELLIVLAI